MLLTLKTICLRKLINNVSYHQPYKMTHIQRLHKNTSILQILNFEITENLKQDFVHRTSETLPHVT